jgi:malonate-semialdehyde dehydrogenase (acetylating)/methylmalonate-semialdehyde dehydrogenase
VVVAVGAAADKLIPKMLERIAKLKTGPGSDPASEMGPLITRPTATRWPATSTPASRGRELLADGRSLKVKGHENGFFLGPCLFDRVQPSMSIYQDEIFGPVLGVTRVDTYDQAIALVNGNPYANGVALFTNDGGAARKFQHEVEVGMVGINVPIPVPMSYYSFGGWKASLFGDLHIYGTDGVRFYTRNKVVTSRWPDPRFRGVDLGFPVTAGALVWDAPACADCRLEHNGAARGDCLDVAAGADNANDERDAYSLCATGPSTVRAEVGVRRSGGTGRTARWQVDGVRRP